MTYETALSLPDRYASDGDFTFIDLFAGIGGLRRAMEQAGGRCVMTSEWDKFAQATYHANFPTTGRSKATFAYSKQMKSRPMMCSSRGFRAMHPHILWSHRNSKGFNYPTP